MCENGNIENKLFHNTPLKNIMLPNEWVLYLYDKQLFKKLANRSNFQAKPYKENYIIKNMNDLVFLLHLMKIKVNSNGMSNKINLDMNDYIIMRKGIEPIWEDPKNYNGGTFTIKIAHEKGYDLWSTFIMYMLGETLTNEMNNINGITVSYISDTSSNSYTYIKIWDARPDRTRDQFVNILPINILEKIKDESLMYSQNNKKKDFGVENIIKKLHNNSYGNREKGGFTRKKHY